MKKMKFNIWAIGAMVGALSMTSCNESFLEQEPPTKATLNDYFSTEAHLDEALATVYVPLRMYDYNTYGGYSPLNFSDILGDDFLTGAAGPTDQEQWHRAGNYTLTGEQTLHGYWANSFDGIKTANETISYVEAAGNKISPAAALRIKSEAAAMRAFYYTIAWKWFGNIPFFTKALGANDKVAQADHDAVYAGIVGELEGIIASNGLPMHQDDDNLGRATMAMVYMLYAEVVMYQNDATRFDKALQYMQKILEDPKYTLNPSFADLWSPDGEWCSESIFEINYTDGASCVRGYDNIAGIGGTWLPQVNGPEGGVSSDPDVLGGGWGTCIPRRTALESYESGDNRIPVTFIDCAPGKPRYQNQDLFNNKYAPRASHIAEGTGGADHCRYNDNFRIYRYAETLLNAAELIARGAKNNTGRTADDLLNEVRSRAGLPLSVATLDNILTERRHEFCGEGKRYWDLVRMEDVAGVSQKASALLVPDAQPVNATGDLGRTGTWTPSKKYIPIKDNEISSSQGAIQQNSAYLGH